MTPNSRHIECVFGKRADGEIFAFRYTVDRVQELYCLLESFAARDDVSFDYDDMFIFMTSVRERLRSLSEAVR